MGETNGSGRREYLLFVSTPSGYHLRELEGDPPQVGYEFEERGQTLVVTKVGASPLPNDRRPCAYSTGKR